MNCSPDPGPYRDSVGLGPKQFLMPPLKVCTSNSAAGMAANFRETSPLTDSPSILASGASDSATVMSPEMLLNRPLARSDSSSVALPLTVLISASPPPPIRWISPLMVRISTDLAPGAFSRTSPLTVVARTSPPTSPLNLPLTDCAFRSPSTPFTSKSELTSVTVRELLAGTCTMRCASPPEPQMCEDPATTWMDVRRPEPDTSTRSTPSSAVPPTSTSLRSQPSTSTLPARLKISTSPRGSAARLSWMLLLACTSDHGTTSATSAMMNIQPL